MGVTSSDAQIQFPRGAVSAKTDMAFLEVGEFAVDTTGGDVYVRFQDTGDPQNDIVLVGGSATGSGGTGGSINEVTGTLSAGSNTISLPFSVDLETNLVVVVGGQFQLPDSYDLNAAGDELTLDETFDTDVTYLVKEIEPGTGNGGISNSVTLTASEGQTLFDPGFDVAQDGSDSNVWRNTGFQYRGSNQDYTITQVGNIEFNSPLSSGEKVAIQKYGGSFEGGAGSINEDSGTLQSGEDTISVGFGIEQEDHIFLALDTTFRPSSDYTLVDSQTIQLSSPVDAETDWFVKTVAPGDGRGGILQKFNTEATQDQTTVDPGFNFESDGLDIQVLRNGNVQKQGSTEDYTISGGAIVFNSGLNSGDDVAVWKFGGGSQVASHGDSHIGSLESTVSDPIPLSVSNQVINGGFRVWQRGTSFSNVTGYTADKWEVVQVDDTINVDRVTDSKYGDYAIEITDDDTSGREGVSQNIEDTSELAGQKAVVSAWVKEGASSPLAEASLEVQVRDGGGNLLQAPNSQTTLGTEYRRLVVPINLSESADEIRIILRNANQTTGSMIWDGVTLVPGDKPLDYPDVVRPIGEEQSLCERYYEEKQFINTLPLYTPGSTSNLTYRVSRDYATKKAAVPTVNVSNVNFFREAPHNSEGSTNNAYSFNGVTENNVSSFSASFERDSSTTNNYEIVEGAWSFEAEVT